MDISVDPVAFASELDRFRQLIAIHGDGEPFVSFREGVVEAEEGYKLELWEYARQLLAAETWIEDSIGTGAILKATISAIEIKKGAGRPANNLVFWLPRGRGPGAREHLALIEAVDQPELRQKLERLLFDLYRSAADEGVIFDELKPMLRGKFPLLAYLYFLKDMDRFMPIQPTTFDAAFGSIGIDMKTRGRCSWANYQAYNQALLSVRDMLVAGAAASEVRLIDAHSFLWSLQKLKTPDQATPVDRRRAMEKSIEQMVRTVLQTVTYSNGQTIAKTVKNKDLRMSPRALSKHVKMLCEKQKGRCALSGIELQYRGLGLDPNFVPSLDRIDSSGHYADGNLQVVCRFINKWKSSSDNDEFRRLLKHVQSVAP